MAVWDASGEGRLIRRSLGIRWRHYTRGSCVLLLLFLFKQGIGSGGHAALPVGYMDFAGGIPEEGTAAGFAVFVGSGANLESGIGWVRAGGDAIAEMVAALCAGGDVFVDERGLVGRDVVFGRGAELRKRVGQFAVGAAIG